MTSFDPSAAATPGSGVFGLPFSAEESRIHLLPVPFDATTSYGGGAASGPEAIREASRQVDLFDHQFGQVYEAGIFMEPSDSEMAAASRTARALASPIIEKGGADAESADDQRAIAEVNAACEKMNGHVHDWTRGVLEAGRVPGLVGGDHSTPFGAIQACGEIAAARGVELGVLQIDAHMDLREAYEGFTWSHASIMWNVLERIPTVSRLVQIGIRDYCEEETGYARGQRGRISTQHDFDWWRWMDGGATFRSLCERTIDELPALVYVSLDIDGLSPDLCPGTGTPVPGGLTFNQAAALLECLHASGRRIVGFDLNEVCPREGDGEWNANVGARMLYKLCGVARPK